MRQLKRILTAFMIAGVLLLSGCGFQLRGYQQIPPQLHFIYLQTPEAYSAFAVQFKQFLKSFKVNMTPVPGIAPATLQIMSENFTEGLVAISPNTQVRTYSLVFKVKFQVKDRQGHVILNPTVISANSSYETSDVQLLGDAEVLEQLQRQLHQQVISLIFERLNSTQGRAALGKLR